MEHLKKVFQFLGCVFVNFLQLTDIHCLFRISSDFYVFLHHLLDGIAHSTNETVGSQGRGFDGRITSYVRWMFPNVLSSLVPRFSCCLHEGINAGNIFDLAKIVYFKPIREIKISIGDGSSSSEFLKLLCGFNDNRQAKLLNSSNKSTVLILMRSLSYVTNFQLMMDSSYDGYYYIDTIGCVFPNVVQLDLVDAEKNTPITETECLVQCFARLRILQILNITGNFNFGISRNSTPPRSVQVFYNCLTHFSVEHNNKINDNFFDILATFAINLKSVYILDCPKISVECLNFLARCKNILSVSLPRRMENDINIEAFMIKFRKPCRISFI